MRRHLSRVALTITAVAALVASATAAVPAATPTEIATAAAQGPNAIDLGTLGGTFSVAADVNARGQVAGESSTAGDEIHAFSWTETGGMVDLGTLGGTGSGALAVNDRGQVIGAGITAAGWDPCVLLDGEGRHDRPRHPRRQLQRGTCRERRAARSSASAALPATLRAMRSPGRRRAG